MITKMRSILYQHREHRITTETAIKRISKLFLNSLPKLKSENWIEQGVFESDANINYNKGIRASEEKIKNGLSKQNAKTVGI